MTETYVQRNYKDTMFRMLFKEKENLLSLYNAVNKTSYTNVEELEITRMEKPELELMVRVYNINSGYNPELMEACCLLKEYAQYVEQVRRFAKKLPFQEAVEQAVDHCIRNGVLADFLLKNRAEAIAVSIFEYDEEKHLKSERDLAYKNGEEAGIAKGIAKGRTIKLIKQICKKIEKGQGPEKIAEELEEELENVMPIYELAAASSPEYDSEKIYEELQDRYAGD